MSSPRVVVPRANSQQQVLRRVNRLDQCSHGWWGILVHATRDTLHIDSAITAAAIAYFAVFSIFPFTLLSITIASFSLGALMDQELIIQKLEFIAPALGRLLGANITEILQARGPVSLVALLGLIWSASNIFFLLTGTLNDIWRIQRGHPVWKRRSMAIVFVLLFVGPVLFLASFASSLTTNLLTGLPDQVKPLVGGASLLLAGLLDVALFLVVYRMLPHADSSWRVVLPGAIGAGLLWELAKRGFLFFVSAYLSVSNLVYGSVTAILAFLTWAYLSGLIFLFGAHLSVAYYRLKQGSTPGLPSPSSKEMLKKQVTEKAPDG